MYAPEDVAAARATLIACGISADDERLDGAVDGALKLAGIEPIT